MPASRPGDGFASFPGLAEEDRAVDLEDLRRTFRRRAHAAAQELVASALLREGHTHDDLPAMTLGEVPQTRSWPACSGAGPI